jgi:hypothetical protein
MKVRNRSALVVGGVAAIMLTAGSITAISLAGTDDSRLSEHALATPPMVLDADSPVPSPSETATPAPVPSVAEPTAATAPAPADTPTQKKTAAADNTGGGSAGQGIAAANAPGWRLVFSDDFSAPVALGNFASSSYGSRYSTYNGPDSSGVGTYDTAQVLSVGNGWLDMYLHTANNQALSAAIVPQVPGQVYGRYSVTFRADSMQDYGAAFLLWPDSEEWNDGEIDFPEAPFTGTMSIHDHCIGHAQDSCYDVDTGVSWTNTHTAVTEWTPGLVRFFIDGNLVGQSDVSPTAKMHMVIQTGTNGTRPPASVAGHVQIDAISIWALG